MFWPYRWLRSKVVGGQRDGFVLTIDGKWHNVGFTKKTWIYLCNKTGLKIIKLKTVSINDIVYGFVQPIKSILYTIASVGMDIMDNNSQLLLIAAAVPPQT